jgi:hypothetical protein
MAVMVGVQGGKGLYRLGYVPRTLAPVAAVMGGQLPALRVVSGSWGRVNKTTYGAWGCSDGVRNHAGEAPQAPDRGKGWIYGLQVF